MNAGAKDGLNQIHDLAEGIIAKTAMSNNPVNYGKLLNGQPDERMAEVVKVITLLHEVWHSSITISTIATSKWRFGEDAPTDDRLVGSKS